jgi:hypothetical protein
MVIESHTNHLVDKQTTADSHTLDFECVCRFVDTAEWTGIRVYIHVEMNSCCFTLLQTAAIAKPCQPPISCPSVAYFAATLCCLRRLTAALCRLRP